MQNQPMPPKIFSHLPNELHHTKLASWLVANGSLTAKIEQFSAQKLIVKPTFEGRQMLTLPEIKQLQLPMRPHSAWVRESLLFGKAGESAWIKARSVFGFHILSGKGRKLANLGQCPIGYVIFARPCAVLVNRHYQLTADGWQRQSVYRWYGKHLLISEIFLSDFVDKYLS
ncbi:chorismate lyase [Moraxella macacae 0408225]|uniref:Chorismate lyase n=1 Tax=Moraxella macacae 0408225 TaxID=1230338 RepID=L2F811_9GAMM|nr:chorismate lyase [Moraxella macacae]ELA08921.1 chorismate lyase [Moraxella macacae 0408225]